MKIKILSLLAGILSLSVAFIACQKENSGPGATTEAAVTAEATAQGEDQSRVTTETDETTNDVNTVMDVTSGFAGRGYNLDNLLCNATIVVDTSSNPRTITITFNGLNCNGTRFRTGVIVISMAQGVRWKNPGAQITVSYQNLKITRVSDNKSITINGNMVHTNVSGGLLINLSTLGHITHTLTSSGMSITFDDGTTRNWQIAKQRDFTYSNGVVITTIGTHTDGPVTGISEWGTNRRGNAFTTSITSPLIIRQDCAWRLTAGEVKHVTPNVTATVTFGLDANGNPTSCPGTGTYYYKLVWVGPNGNSHTLILPY
jgi:hypothetical protein